MMLVRQETEAEAEVEAGTGDVQPAQARSLMKGDDVVIIGTEERGTMMKIQWMMFAIGAEEGGLMMKARWNTFVVGAITRTGRPGRSSDKLRILMEMQ
jgi:hypothetical protein